MSGLADITIFVNALGWTLIHFLWQGAMVAILMWLIYSLIPQNRSQQRYLAGLCLYLLLLPVSISTFLFFSKSTSITTEILSGEFPMVSVASGVKPGLGFWLDEGIEPILPLIVILWALGVTLLALKTLFAWVGTRWLVRKNVTAISTGLQERVDRLMIRFHVRQAVSVLVSTRVKVPTVIGWIRPVILIPAGVLARLPVQQLEMVIAHELGHIRRYDYLANLLQVVIDTLFFYHPGVRWMSSRIRQEREHCCDDFVLSHQCRPSLYARALANLEILRRPAHTTVLAATGGDLLHRVHRIAGSDLPGKSAGFAQLAMMTVLIAVAAAGASSGLEISAYSPVVSSETIRMTGRYTFAGSLNSGRDQWMDQLEPYDRIRQGNENSVQSNVRQDPPINNNQAEQSTNLTPVVKKVSGQREHLDAESSSQPVHSETKPPSIQLAGLDRSMLAQPDRSMDRVVIEAADSEIDKQQNGEKPRKKATVKPIKTVSPKYPSYARSRAVEGWVKLSFTVDKRGRAKDIKVLDGSPLQVFDRAAEKALRKWKFEILPGHNVDKSLVQTFDFSMYPSDVRPVSRNRRCNKTGSNICGMFYRQETVENYGPQSVRIEASNKH